MDEIRSALEVERNRIIPTALVATAPSAPVTISPQKKRAAHEKLMESDGPAKKWLHDRGITDELIARYELGIARSKVGNLGMLPAISIRKISVSVATPSIHCGVESVLVRF